MENSFYHKLRSQWVRGKFVCVGLDPVLEKIPKSAKRATAKDTVVAFNEAIIKETCDIVCAYKPNMAFYASYEDGFKALQETICIINDYAPHVPVILDGKRTDISKSNDGYVIEAFDILNADAVTVNPYLGREALKLFLEREDRGIIPLCKTSNPGSGEFQDLVVNGKPLYQHVAQNVADEWNENGNCSLVVGATFPEELHQVRQIIGDMPILIPGIGTQGGDLKKTVAAGKDSQRMGMIINSSSGIIFASSGEDFPQKAREKTKALNDAILKCR